MSILSPDVTALLNIMANGGEIAGISSGVPLLILSFIPYANGLKGYSSKLAILGLVMAVVGLAYPGIMNIAVEAIDAAVLPNYVVAVLAAVIATLFLFVSWFAAYLMPTIIAVREQRERKVAIIVCNVLAIVPGPWLLAFIWACMPDKPPTAAVESPFVG